MASSPSREVLLDERDLEDTSRPLSGPGTSRHTRRLQLRNAKFQGSALPARKVTPQSRPSSSHWSTAGDIQFSSDVENRSPGGTGALGSIPNIREPSGALQELSNVSLPRRKRSKHRVSLGKLFAEDASHANTSLKYDSTSPEGQRTSMLPRAVRLRAKNGHARQSLNTETRKYIEHLETELSTAQSQLSAATSPSVTREQSSKLRNLNTETRQLQDELADWEAKYEQRVEEAADVHRENESRLRSRVRALEQEAEEAKLLMQDLRGQLESSNQILDAAETANVNLEKRLEIMSEILATAPNKIDLHVEIPGRARQPRPRSMLPRFPTAGALIASPDRNHASSPSPAHAHPGSVVDPLGQGPLSPVGFSSDAESYFSESSTGAIGTENPWGIPQAAIARARPVRRMRRFGAGSFGPKPLILPSASSYEQNPMSAPPLDRSDGDSVFPFPPPRRCHSPDLDHRRLSAMESNSIAARMFESPMLEISSPSTDGEVDNTLMCAQSPHASSTKSGPDYSSLGPATGRNLMDELEAIQASDMTTSVDAPSECPNPRASHLYESTTLFQHPPHRHPSQTDSSPHGSALIVASHDWHLFHPRNGHVPCLSRSLSAPPPRASPALPPSSSSSPAFERLRLLFGEAWRNPVALARHLVQTAQSRMRLPSPLLNVQWWLVGVLLGPMARRRLLTRGESSSPSGDDDDDDDGDRNPDPAAEEDADILAYGSLYETPPGSPAPSSLSCPSSLALQPGVRSGSLVAGMGKKRVAREVSREYREEGEIGFKHSPWLWLKFSITLAFAVGVAFRDGPGSLMRVQRTRDGVRRRGLGGRRAGRDPVWVLTP